MPAAYQDENGKWWKQCSSTKQLFGGVDTKEELAQWFNRQSNKDGFTSQNKSVIAARSKKHYDSNISKSRKIRKEYREKNKFKIKELGKQYRLNNRQKLNEKSIKYSKTANGMLKKYKSSAKKRGIDFTLTLEWFEEQMTKPQFNICAVSHVEFVDDGRNPLSRSLDRVDSTKGYHPNNVKWICFKFNSYKSDLTADDVGMLHKYMLDNLKEVR